jgi:EpsD family peptidyl-prolyl cis-trans isomerase
MAAMNPIRTRRAHRPSVGLAALAAVALSAVLLPGCGDKKKDKSANQAAVRVNGEDVTVQEIGFVLQQRALPPEPAASAGRQVLERLIDQELAVQKAAEHKLDRDPKVALQLDAARREILARAYLEKVGAGATKPTSEEIKAYFDANPALFTERRIYSLQELAIEARPEQMDELKAKLGEAKDIGGFVEALKARNIRFAANQVVRPAEQLPLSSLGRISKMKDGQAIFNAVPNGALVVILAGSRNQPIDEEHARPAIEQLLLNERKRKAVDEDIKALRAAARIEYLGDFAKPALDAKADAAKAAAPEIKPAASEPAVAPASALPMPAASAPPAK